jgi:hypothetical protein
MAHFIIEVNMENAEPANPGCGVHEMATIIHSADGRLIDFSIKPQLLILIVEAKSELIIVDLLEANAFSIEQVRHIFLLESRRTEELAGSFDYVGFFGGGEFSNAIAIEVYPR